SAALAGAAQAHVDDLGRVRVVRHAVDMATGSPGDGIGDVRGGTAAMAEHAYGFHFGTVGGTGDAGIGVGHCVHGTGHVGAVPGTTGSGVTTPAAHAGVDPVAGIVSIGVATVAVTGDVRVQVAVLGLAVVADEIVAGHHVVGEVLV